MCREGTVLADVSHCDTGQRGGQSGPHYCHLLSRKPGHPAGLLSAIPRAPHLQDAHGADLCAPLHSIPNPAYPTIPTESAAEMRRGAAACQ